MALEPSAIAQRGRKIYDRVRHRFESDNRGAFAIIDLNSEKILLADSPESAYREARKEQLKGPFHFVRVGHPGVYRTTRPQWRRRAAG